MDMNVLIPIGIIVLCLAGAVALIALAYFLIKTIKSLQDTMVKVNSLLDDAKELTERCKPVVERVDPMMDRATLTIDAANLEIMRVDQILEDVNTITASAAKATNAVDTVASAPVSVIANAASKIRDRLAPLTYGDDSSAVTSAARAADCGLEKVEDAMEQVREDNQVKQVANAAAAAERDGKTDEANGAASTLKGGVYARIENDTKF